MCRLAEGEHDSQGTVLSELVDSLRTLLSSRCKYRNFLRGLQEKTHNSLNLPLQKLDCSGKVVIFATLFNPCPGTIAFSFQALLQALSSRNAGCRWSGRALADGWSRDQSGWHPYDSSPRWKARWGRENKEKWDFLWCFVRFSLSLHTKQGSHQCSKLY